MELDRYLFENKMTTKEFAKLCDLDPRYMSRIKVGNIAPGRKACRKIYEMSNGKVSLMAGIDIRNINMRKQKKIASNQSE